jgi:MYXO-CTERM domain-containing protein
MRSRLWIACSLFFSTTALADIGPRPSCPPGQSPAYRYGHYCAPVSCATDADCGDGTVCAERALCLRPRGDDVPDEVGVVGACEGGAACAEGARCATAKFCGARKAVEAPVPPPAPPAAKTAPASKGCGVAPGAETELAPLAVLALGLGLALRARRRG